VGACRVGTDEKLTGGLNSGSAGIWSKRKIAPIEYEHKGRWPPHLLLDGSAAVVGMFPETVSGTLNPCIRSTTPHVYKLGMAKAGKPVTSYHAGDSGSAARFFPHLGYGEHDLDIPPIHYCAKASKQDRDEGCESDRYVLRADLSEDQKNYVISELKRLGLIS
jgi:hypothetical protein